MKIRPFSIAIPSVSVSPWVLRALGCCLLLAACSSDEPATDMQLLPAAPGVFTGDPGGAPPPAVDESSGAPPVAVPLSTPPAEEEPNATETNFLVPRCKNGGDAGVESGAADAGLLDAGLSGVDAGVAADAAAASGSLDQRCGAP